MRYRRLDLNLLIALEALLTEKNVTAAAGKLNMTQPAMSGALARLRENFDDPLLVQVGRKLQLTARAEALIEPLQDIILRIDSAMSAEPSFVPASSERHFTIMASDYSISVFLLEVLQQVRREAPGISVEFRQSSALSQQALNAGDIDFVIGPEIDVSPEHPHVTLFSDSYTVMAWNEHSTITDSLDFEEYMAMGHVVFRSEAKGDPWFERWFRRTFEESRQVEIISHTFGLIPQLVVGTDLLATLQTRLARKYADVLPLKMLQPPFEFPQLTEVLQWNSYRDEDPATRWFRNRIIRMASKMADELESG